MKHIVFVIGYYFPEAGSTSLCAIKVMNDLIKRYDVSVSCVCGTNGIQGVEHKDNKDVYKIHHVSYTDCLEKSQRKIVRRFTKVNKVINDIINLQYYPDMDIKYSRSICDMLDKIERKKHIDCIVAVYMPKQSISGVLMFKEKNPEVPTIAYFLDTLRSNKHRLLPMSFHTKMLDKYESRIFDTFNKIILMEYGTAYYSKRLCKRYSDKISLLGLPSLEIMNLRTKNIHGMKCTYIGTTYSDIRNPIYAMKVFAEANKIDSRILFQIYGPSNMKTELLNWQAQHSRSFYYHGFIDHEKISSVYEDTDYIVSIGNTLKGIVPGKTFEIIGALKPIIHFTDCLNDTSLKYLKQYPNICIIGYEMSIEEAARCLIEFLKKPYFMCDSSVIEHTFYYAKPDTVSDLIYNTMR